MYKFLGAASCLAMSLAFSGCTQVSEGSQTLSTRAIDYSQLKGWNNDTQSQLLSPFLEECRKLGQLPPDTVMGGPAQGVAGSDALPLGRHAGDWLPACRGAQDVPLNDDQKARSFFEEWFEPYVVSNAGDEHAKFTGYFEPEIRGSLSRQGIYQTPVYARPHDLVREKATDGSWHSGHWVNGVFAPYFSRKEIDGGALDGRHLEFLWVADPIDLFFLQIQGSGRIRLSTGQVVRVGFDGKNGQPYVPLGRVMVDRGLLAANDVSMQSIRSWLAAHPDQAKALMEENSSYVFFKLLDNEDVSQGAPGALGVALTPSRSVAIDRAYLPLAAPVWIDTQVPTAGGGQGSWQHLALAQDLGTDIKGPARADLFLGWGQEAAAVAGSLHSSGTMTVLLPRPVAQQ